MAGVEPARHCCPRILSPVCLPIPSHGLLLNKESYPAGAKHQRGSFPLNEVSPGFEPGVELLQSSALPLGYDTDLVCKSAASLRIRGRRLRRFSSDFALRNREAPDSRPALAANRIVKENTTKKTCRQGIWAMDFHIREISRHGQTRPARNRGTRQ